MSGDELLQLPHGKQGLFYYVCNTIYRLSQVPLPNTDYHTQTHIHTLDQGPLEIIGEKLLY